MHIYLYIFLQTIKIGKVKWIGLILRRNRLLKHVIEGYIEGRIEVMEGRGRRRKQLVDDLKQVKEYCKLKEEALDRDMGELALEEAMHMEERERSG